MKTRRPVRIPLASVLALLVLPLLVVAAQAQEQHPIAAQVKADLKDPAKPFTLVVILQVNKGDEAKLEAAFAKAVKPTRKEKGCLAYDLNRDAKEPGRYFLYERWQNLPALEAHLRSAHITTLLAEVKDLLAGNPEIKVLLPAGE